MNYLNKAFNKEQATAIEKYVAVELAKLAKPAPAVVEAVAPVKPVAAVKKAPVQEAEAPKAAE